MNNKISLKEFKEQIIDLIYEVMEEELKALEDNNKSKKDNDADRVPYEDFIEKNFEITSAGDQIFRDKTNPEIYSHAKKKEIQRVSIAAPDAVFTKKRDS